MSKTILFLLLVLMIGKELPAQEGCQFKIILDGYTHDTIWLGYTFGKREMPEFFGLRQADGSYLLECGQEVPDGMYAIIYRKNPATFESFQCWLAQGQRHFTIETKAREPYQATIQGSAENDILYRYNKEYKPLDQALDHAIDQYRYLPNESNFYKRVAAEKAMHDMQQRFIAQHSGTLTASLIRQTMLPIPPENNYETTEWQAAANQRWLWQKQHYFDFMDIGKEDFTRKLQWLEATDFFLFRLPPPDPDTTIALMDDVLKKLENNPDAWQYYHKYLTTSLSKMSQYRLDEVFVHMVKKYVQTGKATWPKADDQRKIQADADRMAPLFQGKKAPNITLYDKGNLPFSLHDIQAPYSLLVFWMPDCSHCKKEIPQIKEAYSKYKDKGLKVVSVCGKFGNDIPKCWEFVDSMQFPSEWQLGSDPERRSNMASLFNLRSFPRIFLLDRDKNIVFKRSGEMEAWQWDAVLGNLNW